MEDRYAPRRNTNSLLWILVLILLVGVGIAGGVAGYNVGSQNVDLSTGIIPGIGGAPDESIQSAIVTPSPERVSDLRVELQALIREHGVLGSDYLIKTFDEDDGTALKGAMEENTQKIVNHIRTVYGTDRAEEFHNLWMDHMREYENYTVALRENNAGNRDTARENLARIANNFEVFLAEANEESVDRASDLMQEHINGTLAIVDAHADDNPELVVELKQQAYEQAGRFADYLVDLISTERPELFR